MSKLKKILQLSVFNLLAATTGFAQALGAPDCAQLLLVSGYNSDNVKIYDGCDGQFIRNLDDTGTVAGPQAMVEGPDGDLFVVSEKNHRVVRFNRQTLTMSQIVIGDNPATPEDESSGLLNPTGAAFDDNGILYVGSFAQDVVQKFNPETGADLGQLTAPRTGGVRGIDAGMRFGPDGHLNIPGFDSNSVVRVDAQTGLVTDGSITAGSGGLNAPRVVLFTEDNQRMLVSSWRNGRILEYNAVTGAFIRQFGTTILGITGMAFGPNNVLFVTSDQDNQVHRINAISGEFIDTLIPAGSGGLDGATFIHVLNKQQATVDITPQQFWLTGLGNINEKTISVDQVTFTTGGAFGDNFSAQSIRRFPWGSINIIFSDCNTAQMSYEAGLETSGLFNSGGYTITRLIANTPGDSCLDQGFDNVTNGDWMTGAWAGIPERSGEGFFIDAVNGDRVIVAWFSYMAEGFVFPEG